MHSTRTRTARARAQAGLHRPCACRKGDWAITKLTLTPSSWCSTKTGELGVRLGLGLVLGSGLASGSRSGSGFGFRVRVHLIQSKEGFGLVSGFGLRVRVHLVQSKDGAVALGEGRARDAPD